MKSNTDIFLLIFLISSFINDAYSNHAEGSFYIKDVTYAKPKKYLFSLSINRTFQLSPDNTVIKVNTQGKLYLKKHKKIPNAYTASLLNSQSDFLRDGCPVLDSDSCDAWRSYNQDSNEPPFIIVFDCNNLLKHIVVNATETEQSQNYKLFLASLLQYNNELLIDSPEQDFNYENDTTELQEVTLFGECNVKYNLTKNVSSNANDYTIRKSYDTKTCEVMNEKLEEVPLLKKICKSENKLNWTMNSEVEVSQNDNFPKTVKTSQFISFIPLKESAAKINVTFEHTLSQIPLDDIIIPQFNGTDTIKLSKIRYYSVNESIITSNYEGKLRDLQRVYKSLSCEVLFLQNDMGLIARSFRCI